MFLHSQQSDIIASCQRMLCRLIYLVVIIILIVLPGYNEFPVKKYATKKIFDTGYCSRRVEQLMRTIIAY
jgi:hypothetical protein